MVLELVFGFLLLVAASYLGTTMALRSFFGRERYGSPTESRPDDPPDNDGGSSGDGGDSPRNYSADE